MDRHRDHLRRARRGEDHLDHRDADQNRGVHPDHQGHRGADHRGHRGVRRRDLDGSRDPGGTQGRDGNRAVRRDHPVHHQVHQGRDHLVAAGSDDRTATTDDHQRVAAGSDGQTATTDDRQKAVHQHRDAVLPAACRGAWGVMVASPGGPMDGGWLPGRGHRSR